MIAAALGAGARPLPDGAGNWAALIACASNAGGGAALALELPRDLAFAASDAISTTPVPTRPTTNALPTCLPIDEGPLPQSPRRLIPTRPMRFLTPATADPKASESIPMVGSCSCRRGSADMENTLNLHCY